MQTHQSAAVTPSSPVHKFINSYVTYSMPMVLSIQTGSRYCLNARCPDALVVKVSVVHVSAFMRCIRDTSDNVMLWSANKVIAIAVGTT